MGGSNYLINEKIIVTDSNQSETLNCGDGGVSYPSGGTDNTVCNEVLKTEDSPNHGYPAAYFSIAINGGGNGGWEFNLTFTHGRGPTSPLALWRWVQRKFYY